MPYWGELAALGTAACWSLTAIFFAEAGRRVGSHRVNKIRLIMAVLLYAAIMTAVFGSPFPTQATWQQTGWLALSGLIGLVLGDGALFRAFVMIGPRLATLLMATAPIFATIIAWIFLGERLGIMTLLGIALTIGGVMWVVLERQFGSANRFGLTTDHPDAGSKTKGVILATIGAFGQATGLVLSKQAMVHAGEPLDPMPASMIRMIASMFFIWGFAVARNDITETVRAVSNRSAMLFALGGTIFGPVLGVWLSLVAVNQIEAGVAATLNGTTPIIIIPVVYLVYRERVSVRALFGTVLAVIGVALLFSGDALVR